MVVGEDVEDVDGVVDVDDGGCGWWWWWVRMWMVVGEDVDGGGEDVVGEDMDGGG